MTEKKAALEAEANESTVRTFEFKGKEYTVDSDPEKWSLEATLAYEENRSVGALKALLGEEQWFRFMAMKPTNKDFSDFSEALFNTIGVSTGE